MTQHELEREFAKLKFSNDLKPSKIGSYILILFTSIFSFSAGNFPPFSETREPAPGLFTFFRIIHADLLFPRDLRSERENCY